ncbi:MAG: hypothetical protein WC823_07530 [Parcubacteria group bacterium]|jgi:hypothetical protein
MRKNKIKQITWSVALMVGGLVFVCLGSLARATTNPNYGTTTFFSNKKEKPVLESPILGAEDPSNSSDGNHNKENKKDDNSEIINPNDIFNIIGDGVGAVVDSSINAFDETKKSLFDFQSEIFGSSDSFSGDNTTNNENDLLIAGPRGESLAYMATQNDANDTRLAEFNFEDVNLKVAPKKSKLLFTNKEVAIDMTTQYVVVILIFVMAMGSAVGYYYAQKGNAKNKEEDYD